MGMRCKPRKRKGRAPSEEEEKAQSASKEASNAKTTVTVHSNKDGKSTAKEADEKGVEEEEKATESPDRETNKAKGFWTILPQRPVQINQKQR